MAINVIDLSAQAIRISLFDIQDEDFVENNIHQLRLKIGHLNRQWELFHENQQDLIEHEISERARERQQNYHDDIEEIYNQTSQRLYDRVIELNQQFEHQQSSIVNNAESEFNEFNNANNDSFSESQDSGEHIAAEDEINRANNTVNKQSQSVNQPASIPQIIVQYPTTGKIENIWGEFDGNLTQWSGFHDRFKANVHDNEKISGAMKFQYLRNSLKGYAAAAIGEWQQTDENYLEAWDRLNELYN